MTLGDWDKAVAEMTDEAIQAKIEALNTLLDWPIFKQAYDGYGVTTVRAICESELKIRASRAAHARWQAERERSTK